MSTNLCRDESGAYVVYPHSSVPRHSDIPIVRDRMPDVPAPSIWREVARMPLADWGRAAMLLVMLAVVCAAFYAFGEANTVGHVATATGGAR